MSPRFVVALLGLALWALCLAGCGAARPPAAWRHACIAYNPGRDAVFPIDGYPLSVLDDGWRRRGGGLTMDGPNMLVLNADVALTHEHVVLRMAVQPAPDGPRSDQCGPAYLVVTAMSVDGEVQDSINLERSLSIMTEAAALHLGVAKPIFPPQPAESVAPAVGQTTPGQSPAPTTVPDQATDLSRGTAATDRTQQSLQQPGSNEADAAAQALEARRAEQQRVAAEAEALRQEELRRAREQAATECRDAYDEVYARYIAHPTQEGGAAVTRASAIRAACMAGTQQQ